MDFVISRATGRVYCQGIPAKCAVSLASNIDQVVFEGGAGKIFYNDRLMIAEPFSDPSPYQPYINAWIQAMQAASPALTLAQAQAIKNGFINEVYQQKRQLPVSVQVSSGTYTWDASDDAVARSISPISGLVFVGPLNTVIGGDQSSAGGVNSLVSTLGRLVSDLNAWGTNYNNMNANLYPFYGQVSNAINTINSDLAAIVNVLVNQGFASSNLITSVSQVSNPQSGADSGLTETFSGVSAVSQIQPPTLQLIPIGQTNPVSLTSGDLESIVLAIAAQNTRSQQALLTKQAAVNALATIAAVAGYDGTTGW
ncbi:MULTISPECIES: hypothetical protein [unclassified Bradyrhizobium]|uniref:hypothetical protein n=1 Tax=unclassified Bradyrhizobium TaxID=2631580 RepID=UPI0028E39945|nr:MULTISPECIES: hypothetical protein [unclassified Bradyrhizobium]